MRHESICGVSGAAARSSLDRNAPCPILNGFGALLLSIERPLGFCNTV
ncbi:MAG: hypothetical protein J7641_21410 [Cyanobacteria bacterium SID2]|nr:hypothetical protein [Cyanobacteria bacterium SID2]MBP0003294.1 hypothetical protein [Cyanobacteria bacterium SBC]